MYALFFLLATSTATAASEEAPAILHPSEVPFAADALSPSVPVLELDVGRSREESQDATLEQLVERVVILTAWADASDVSRRDSWCALAAYGHDNPHVETASLACAQWTTYLEDLQKLEELFWADLDKLKTYLDLPDKTIEEKLLATATFLGSYDELPYDFQLAEVRRTHRALKRGKDPSSKGKSSRKKPLYRTTDVVAGFGLSGGAAVGRDWGYGTIGGTLLWEPKLLHLSIRGGLARGATDTGTALSGGDLDLQAGIHVLSWPSLNTYAWSFLNLHLGLTGKLVQGTDLVYGPFLANTFFFGESHGVVPTPRVKHLAIRNYVSLPLKSTSDETFPAVFLGVEVLFLGRR